MAMKTMISLKTIKKEGVGDVEEFKNNIQITILVNKESLIKMERDGDTFRCWKNRCKDYSVKLARKCLSVQDLLIFE